MLDPYMCIAFSSTVFAGVNNMQLLLIFKESQIIFINNHVY